MLDDKVTLKHNLAQEDKIRLSILRGKTDRGMELTDKEREDLYELESEQVTKHQAKV